MRTETEIKERILNTYKARDEFSRIIKGKVDLNNQDVANVFGIALEIYTEKISALEWVLEKSECSSVDEGEKSSCPYCQSKLGTFKAADNVTRCCRCYKTR